MYSKTLHLLVLGCRVQAVEARNPLEKDVKQSPASLEKSLCARERVDNMITMAPHRSYLRYVNLNMVFGSQHGKKEKGRK
jgi:hypothetical protein